MVKRLGSYILALVILGCSGALSPDDYFGTWGGEGARLTLSNALARLETSCWSGDLAVPVEVEGRELIASGTLSWHGGAGGTESRGVVIIGRKDDRVLHLTVEGSKSIGPYTLQRGKAANIPGCP